MKGNLSVASPKNENSPWIIFDGDNTLWDVETLYDAARSALCKMLASADVTEEDIWTYQQHRDKELYQTFGYSPARFPQSFADTLLHFFNDAHVDRIQSVKNLASKVFEEKAKPADCVETVLNILGEEYHLALLTAGDNDVQTRRLEHFGYSDFFRWIAVVPQKSQFVFRNLAEQYSIDVSRTWVVGDSIRSDIIPAAKAGMNTIWLKAPNWTAIEHEGHNLPVGTRQIGMLSELPKLLEIR